MEAILETTEIDISSRFNCDAERSVFAGKENKEEEENVVAFLEGKFLMLLLLPPLFSYVFQLFYSICLKIGGNIAIFILDLATWQAGFQFHLETVLGLNRVCCDRANELVVFAHIYIYI